MGWEELEPVTPDIRDVSQKREDTDKLVLRVFGSEDGAKLLTWLNLIYVDVPVAVPGADSSHAYFAEGQRNVVRDIMYRIKRAKEM